jgi:hypothetical protein
MGAMTRLVRRLAACLAIATLAFAQLAVSAYACPTRHHDEAAAAHDAATDHCTKVATTNLCERHCEYGNSSLQSTPPAAIAPDLAPLPWRVELVAAPALERVACKSLSPQRTEPPPLVRFGVLRI